MVARLHAAHEAADFRTCHRLPKYEFGGQEESWGLNGPCRGAIDLGRAAAYSASRFPLWLASSRVRRVSAVDRRRMLTHGGSKLSSEAATARDELWRHH